MTGWLSGLVALLVGGFFAVWILLKPLLAFTKKSDADLSRIRANLEGPQGAAGPAMRVVDIVPTGGTLPSRSRDAERSYLVTLRRPDGQTEQRTVRIEVGLIGQGAMSLDRRPPKPSLVEGGAHASAAAAARSPAWWWRLPVAVRLAVVIVGMGLFFTALEILPALGDIAEAKGQLSYVLQRNDIRIVQLYRDCGVYTIGNDPKPMRFLFADGKVWTGRVGPDGVRRNASYDSTAPYDQWSYCMSHSKGRRGDRSFALWVLGLFH